MAPLLYCVEKAAVERYQQSMNGSISALSNDTKSWTFQDIGHAPRVVFLAVIALPMLFIAIPAGALIFVPRRWKYTRLLLTTLTVVITTASASLLQWITMSLWEAQHEEQLAQRPVGYLFVDLATALFPVVLGLFSWTMAFAISGGFRGVKSWLAHLEW